MLGVILIARDGEKKKKKKKRVQREMERLTSRVLAILCRSWLGRSLLRTICNGGEVGDEFYLLTCSSGNGERNYIKYVGQ